MIETVCKGFEDYAQAKYKSSGEPTIIRLMTHEGNMNPLMSQVDMVPDEDLNTKLKFYVSRDALKISVMKSEYTGSFFKSAVSTSYWVRTEGSGSQVCWLRCHLHQSARDQCSAVYGPGPGLVSSLTDCTVLCRG